MATETRRSAGVLTPIPSAQASFASLGTLRSSTDTPTTFKNARNGRQDVHGGELETMNPNYQETSKESSFKIKKRYQSRSRRTAEYSYSQRYLPTDDFQGDRSARPTPDSKLSGQTEGYSRDINGVTAKVNAVDDRRDSDEVKHNAEISPGNRASVLQERETIHRKNTARFSPKKNGSYELALKEEKSMGRDGLNVTSLGTQDECQKPMHSGPSKIEIEAMERVKRRLLGKSHFLPSCDHAEISDANGETNQRQEKEHHSLQASWSFPSNSCHPERKTPGSSALARQDKSTLTPRNVHETQETYTIPTKIEIEAKERAERNVPGKTKPCLTSDCIELSDVLFGIKPEATAAEAREEEEEEDRNVPIPQQRDSFQRPSSLPIRFRRRGVYHATPERSDLVMRWAESLETGSEMQFEGTSPLYVPSVSVRARRNGLCDETDKAASDRVKARVFHKRL